MAETQTLLLKMIIDNKLIVDERVDYTDQDKVDEANLALVTCAASIANGNTAVSLSLSGQLGKVISYGNVTGLTYQWAELPDTTARRGLPTPPL